MATNNNPIYQHFHALTVKELISDKKQTVVTLNNTDSIEKAITVLSENKILSAPVIEKKSGNFLGFLDTADILKHVVRATPNLAQIKADELSNLSIAGRAIALMAIENVVDFSSDPALEVFEESKCSELLHYFAKGFHRAAVLNSDKSILAVVSQSDIVRHLSQHIRMGKLKDLGESKMEALGYSSTSVVTVAKSKTVLETLSAMVENGVSAIAVVEDEDGRLCGNFSASNVRGLYRTSFPDFLLSVEEFLTKYSIDSLNPICTIASNPLANVVQDFTDSKIHHMWIVNDFKPVGVVSLTDIIKISISEQQ